MDQEIRDILRKYYQALLVALKDPDNTAADLRVMFARTVDDPDLRTVFFSGMIYGAVVQMVDMDEDQRKEYRRLLMIRINKETMP